MSANAVIAVITTIYTAATIALWLTTRDSVTLTRDIFEASHRPFIGVTAIDILARESDIFAWRVTYKNTGSLPASNVLISCHKFVNGQPEPSAPSPGKAMIFPNTPLLGDYKEERPEIATSVGITGTTTFAFAVSIAYDGVKDKRYSTYSKHQYNKESNAFDFIEGSFT